MIHHRLVATVDSMDLDLAANIRPPYLGRWLGVALRCDEKQNIAVKSLWQERLHESNTVLIAIYDRFVVVLLEHRDEMSVMPQRVHHILYRVGDAGEKNFFAVLLIERRK